MTSNVRMILDEVNARIKLAEAKTAEDPSNFDSFPGAENDQSVPAETKKPDPEVKEEGPASRTEVTGAEPGSDVPLQQDHLYEADEPVLTPEKKPAESADAEAKVASANKDVEKVASDILGIIKGAIAKQAELTKQAEESNKVTTAPTKEKDAGCCGGGGSAPAAKKPAAKKTEEKKPEKKASDTISLGQKVLDKLASIRMAKQAGVDDANTLLKAAAEYNRGAADAKALIQKLAQALEESANSADAAEECTGACTPEAGAADDAAAAGAADAEAAIADAAGEAADAAGAEDPVTPEEVAQAVSELVEEGQISEEDAATLVSELGAGEGAQADAGAGDVTDEQLAEGIAQAIDNGDITMDEAQQLVQELVDAGADTSVANEVADAGAAEAGAAEAGATAGEEAGAAAGAEAGAEAGAADDAAAAGAADAEAAIADAQKQAAVAEIKTKIAAALQKKASQKKPAQKQAAAAQVKAAEDQIAKYQTGFIQKCAEYGVDPSKLAQYIQARAAGAL